ncbi:hypothetical protein DRW07_02120 [Alteromonas sediminis]|uniref:Tyr recombinase domain-containing protein n=1 Tax=Alteromonas sediminis TaxID=2259342 RepID=A0A3N5Y2R2_9ALTE|nr:tyrosine-type recombinase/integrase [Alteromonas sediminis]RPJ68227.1 hypothetical protein DRW07_02120 [Alteromonas sediminis]
MSATQYSDNTSVTALNGAVGVTVHTHPNRMLSVEHVMDELDLEFIDVVELFESGELRGRYFKSSNKYKFHPLAVTFFLDQLEMTTPQESEKQAKTVTRTQFHPKKNPVISNGYEKDNKRFSQPKTEHCAYGEVLPATEVKSTTKLVDEPTVAHIEDKSEKSLLDTVLRNKAIDFEHILNNEITGAILAEGKRNIKIDGTGITGLKLELTKSKRRIIVKSNKNKDHSRCALIDWPLDCPPSLDEVTATLKSYTRIQSELDRKPTTQEFKLQNRVVETLGDVLSVHLAFNISETKGEGSEEYNTIKALIKNHLSKPKEVTLPNGSRKSIVLTKQRLTDFSVATFNAYLKSYAENNGVHDKIVTRIKAAINYCLREGLISHKKSLPYTSATRINKERHVVISNEDMKRIFHHISESASPEFALFLLIEATGHFRTKQTIGLKYSQFDFNNHSVTITPKGGNGYSKPIPLHKEVCKRVYERMTSHREEYGRAEFVFPSTQSKSGHRETFDNEWNALRNIEGFYIINEKGKKEYKYRLHDFRETLVNRLSHMDDQSLAALLGHKSTYTVKRYRKADCLRVRQGSNTAYELLPKPEDAKC